MAESTHFGYETVSESDKASRVGEVFRSVSGNYDLMNDLMSGGLHRLWKQIAIEQSGARSGQRVLDIAGGTADLSRNFFRRVGVGGQVVLTDINPEMLKLGRERMIDAGAMVPVIQCDAECLPFPESYFDCVCVAFGLRNMTHKDRALKEMFRVLRPGGRVVILEFSQVWRALQPIYDAFSFGVLPLLGRLVAHDADAYRYLAESIRMHPCQEELKQMMETIGFERVEYLNLTAGVVALHKGYKL